MHTCMRVHIIKKAKYGKSSEKKKVCRYMYMYNLLIYLCHMYTSEWLQFNR